MRPFLPSITRVHGGIAILDQVVNTPAAIAAWEAKASARWGRDVKIFDGGMNASVGRDALWVISSLESVSVNVSQWVGRDLGSRACNRLAFEQLSKTCQAATVASAGGNTDASDSSCSLIAPEMEVPSFGNAVVMTEFTRMKTGSYVTVLGTTIFPNDASRAVLVIAAMDSYFESTLGHRTEAVIRVTDHRNNDLERGGCQLTEAISELRLSVPITTAVTWSVEIGQCPVFHAKFVTWDKWIYGAGVAAATLLIIELYHRMLRKSWADADNQQIVAEKQVHGLIVGYVCHEVRNPLHVLKASVEAMISALRRRAAAQPISPAVSVDSRLSDAQHKRTLSVGSIGSAGSDDEAECVISDCQLALAQMQVCCVTGKF